LAQEVQEKGLVLGMALVRVWEQGLAWVWGKELGVELAWGLEQVLALE
jgi:hypothetical protein